MELHINCLTELSLFIGDNGGRFNLDTLFNIDEKWCIPSWPQGSHRLQGISPTRSAMDESSIPR